MSRRHHRRGEKGAALIEFAIVAPLVLLLVMGTIDFGFIFNDTLQLRQGVREGAREAAVGSFGTNSTCTGNQVPGGSSSQATRLICRTRTHIGLDTSGMRVKVCLPSLATAGTCSTSSSDYQAGNNDIIVCAMYPKDSVTGLLGFLNGGTMRERIVIRLEQTESQLNGVTDDMRTTQEPALSGANWNFCVP
jgi:hypothetical protein